MEERKFDAGRDHPLKSLMYCRPVSISKGTKKVRDGIVLALFGVYLWHATPGECMGLSAQEPKAAAKEVPKVKPHEALDGKACVDCHRRVKSSGVKCLVAKEDLCDFCHAIPAEGGPARLVEASEPMCVQCHKRGQFKGSFAHGPFAVGACTTCHDPHGGEVPGMLRFTGSPMCLKCHKDMRERMRNARFRHEAAVKECTDCHSPHASERQYMLTSAVPELCGKCHEKIFSDLKTAAVEHSPVTEGLACVNCHDPHAAQESGLLIADGLDVCLKCHDKPVKDKDKKQEFADMKQLLAANPYPHGPIRNRDCSACHNPHGSPYFRILTNQYPQNLYAPFSVSNYDLCFRCHDAALATAERTTSATEFRDGDRNLHFVHVNRASRGRTCRTCHEVHASSIPEQISKTVPFGDWELPINYEKSEKGGSCAPGCHALVKYERR